MTIDEQTTGMLIVNGEPHFDLTVAQAHDLLDQMSIASGKEVMGTFFYAPPTLEARIEQIAQDALKRLVSPRG